MGEPFTHPHFNEILKVCEEHDPKIQITTNGLDISKFSALVLSSPSVRQINFSVQCFKDNFPDKNINDYLSSILDFSVMAHKLRPDVYINLRLWNVGETLDNNEDVFLFVEDFFKIKINRHVDVGRIKSKRIWNRVSLHFDSRFEWPSLEAPLVGTFGTCHALKGHIGILADGTVVPCCLDKEGVIPLGNCLTQRLDSILISDRAIQMREGFDKGTLVEELCRHCSYIKRFSKSGHYAIIAAKEQ
jgi:MoaA/NifB/PqqE/SkfB family radical SAM enzyme